MQPIGLILLSIFFYLSTNLNAQNWQYCNPFTPSTPYECKFIGDSLILFTICDNGMGTNGCQLFAFDFQGNLKWISPGGQFVTLSDNEIYIAAFDPHEGGHDCETVFRYFKASFRGDISNEYQYICGELVYSYPLNIDISASGELLISTPEQILTVDETGMEKYSRYFPVDTNILGAYYIDGLDLENIQIAMLYKTQIEYLDNTLTSISINTLNFDIEKFDIKDDTLFILSENRIFRMKDFSNVALDTIIFEAPSEILDFYIANEEIWVRVIQHEEESLQSISLNNTNIRHNFYPKTQLLNKNMFYYLKDNRWFLTGQTGFNQAAILSYPLDSIPEFIHPDVAISDLQISYRKLIPDGPGAPISATEVEFGVDYTIENKGPNTIHSLSFYTILGYYYNWGGDITYDYNKYYWTVDNLNLTPGNSLVLNKSELRKKSSGNSVCIDVLGPNNQIETYINNNSSCTAILSDIESSEESAEISINPNPVNEELFIEFTTNATWKIDLYNELGIKVLNRTVSEDHTNLNVEDFPKGFYFLKIKDESKSRFTIKKIIIH